MVLVIFIKARLKSETYATIVTFLVFNLLNQFCHH
jgi:hypothetical protein